MTQIEATLSERGNRYGPFTGHAHVAQMIKAAIAPVKPKLDKMVAQQDIRRDQADAIVECLDMVAHKIGRIVNGDPLYHDSWHDIIGYVRLVEKMLEEMESVQ